VKRRKPIANLGAGSTLKADALVVKAGYAGGAEPKPRGKRRQIEFVQAAVWVLFRETGAPYGIPRRELLEQVREQLAKDPEWCAAGFRPVSIDTILRAMKLVWSI
jgi:hypothetical protein